MKENKNAWQYFLLVIAALISLTTIKSSAHFTSKYVLQAYPFFLLFIAKDIKTDKYLLLRVIIGTLIGIAAMYSYYVIHAALPLRP